MANDMLSDSAVTEAHPESGMPRSDTITSSPGSSITIAFINSAFSDPAGRDRTHGSSLLGAVAVAVYACGAGKRSTRHRNSGGRSVRVAQ